MALIPERNFVLTDEQQTFLSADFQKDLKVAGVAGSGKTLLLVLRALKISKEESSPRVALLTYTNSLVAYMEEAAEKIDKNCRNYITIMTVDSFLLNFYRKYYEDNQQVYLGSNPNSYAFQQLQKVIVRLKNSTGKQSRFFLDKMQDWLVEEIRWIKNRSTEIHSKEDYLSCQRTGRGVSIRPTKEDRSLIYDIYTAYYTAVPNDADNFFAQMVNNPEQISENGKFDYILVDECQDLSLSRLKLLKILTKKALTCAGDFSQKIYGFAGYTWKEAGINIKGHSLTLKGAFRNTIEIVQLAEDLKKKNKTLSSFEGEVIKEIHPMKHGRLPVIHCIHGPREEEQKRCIERIKELIADGAEHCIGLLLPRWDLVETWKNLLDKEQCSYEVIKRNREDDYHILDAGLKITTYHSSKGLEFDAVLLPELDESVFPFRFNNDGEEDEKNDILDEGRSLLYVAITRSKYLVDIYCCYNYLELPSPLIYELDKSHYALNGFLSRKRDRIPIADKEKGLEEAQNIERLHFYREVETFLDKYYYGREERDNEESGIWSGTERIEEKEINKIVFYNLRVNYEDGYPMDFVQINTTGISEKIATEFVNSDFTSFRLQVAKIDEDGEEEEGWLYDNELGADDYYLFVWVYADTLKFPYSIKKQIKNRTFTLETNYYKTLSANDIHVLQAVKVKRSKLQEWLMFNSIKKDNVLEAVQKMRLHQTKIELIEQNQKKNIYCRYNSKSKDFYILIKQRELAKLGNSFYIDRFDIHEGFYQR